MKRSAVVTIYGNINNQGGRQNDASPSAISALPRVVAATEGRIPVFMDGGIRRGGDIAKALALGATAAFVGRPALYGLATDGAEGAEAVIKLLAAELVRNMTLLGATSVSALPGALERAGDYLA
ncbi:MAG: alpha-hydroxy acid oxidase [Rhodoferax sp.]|nr:alpha-hydroxy acid oxidase [Rhodoferax sp.]